MKKDTLELIELFAKGLKAYVAANADGKIDLNDAAQLLAVWPSVLPAISGIAKVPAELSAMSSEEREQVNAAVANAIDFGGNNEELEAFVEQLLAFTNSAFGLLVAGRKLFSK